MKRLKLFLLMLFTCGLTANAVVDSTEIASLKAFLAQGSNYTQFGIPDLVSLDTYDWETPGNGITWDGTGHATNIDWSNKSLSGSFDATGLSLLQNLTIPGNTIAGINVSGLSGLTILNCRDNSLTSLNVSGCTSLQDLTCYNNQLTTLDASGLSGLTYLSCRNNSLTSLNISGCASLTELYCADNNLSSLDVSGSSSLTILSCYNNSIPSLSISNLSLLKELYCASNSLSTIDVSALNSLELLSCGSNSLSNIDVTNNPNLITLLCQNNVLQSLDVSVNSLLQTLNCSGNSLTSLNVTNASSLTSLECQNNNLLFSTLPVDAGYTTYTYSPQSTQSITAPYNNVDISSEYLINGNTTSYDWGAVSATSVGNGIFDVGIGESGQMIPCLLTNSGFPSLTLTYNVSINMVNPTTIVLTDSTITYDGNPQPGPTATTIPAGLTGITYTYNGTSQIPVDAGVYNVVATFPGDANNAPATSNTATLTITKATPIIVAHNKNVTYDGNPQSVDPATTTPAGLTVTYTYNGSTTPPTDAGVYEVIASFAGDANMEAASDTATLTIDKLLPDMSVPNVYVVYDGNTHSATVTTVPAGLPVTVTYNGSATLPLNIGVYMVEASFAGDANLLPVSVTATLQIVTSSSLPMIIINNKNVNYNGRPQAIDPATILPDTLPVTYTYNGSTTVPTNAGVYTVIATFPGNGQFASVSDTATLTIEKVIPFISIFNNYKIYNGQPQGIDPALTIPAGLPIAYTYNGSMEVPTEVGNYQVVASFAGDENYNPTSITANLVISKSGPTIVFADQIVPFNGNPQAINPATTIPEGLPLKYTYNGSSEIPTKIGTYQVVAIFEGNDTYSPVTSSAVYQITKITPEILIEEQVYKYNGQPIQIKPATVNGIIDPDKLDVTYEFTGQRGTNYPKTNQPPSEIGRYFVLAATPETDIYAASFVIKAIIINETGVGIEEMPEAKAYLADGMLYISTAKAETISIYSLSGAKLYSVQKQAEEELSINTTTWPKGILIVSGNSGWGIKVMNK